MTTVNITRTLTDISLEMRALQTDLELSMEEAIDNIKAKQFVEAEYIVRRCGDIEHELERLDALPWR